MRSSLASGCAGMSCERPAAGGEEGAYGSTSIDIVTVEVPRERNDVAVEIG